MAAAIDAASQLHTTDHDCQRERMNGYFKPLRRKIGIPTLLLACVFAAGWARSLKLGDTVFVRDQFVFLSSGGRLSISTEVSSRITLDGGRKAGFMKLTTRTYNAPVYHGSFPQDSITVLRSNGRQIPYWSIVIPLTAISACLLLSKPRAKDKTPNKPTSENA